MRSVSAALFVAAGALLAAAIFFSGGSTDGPLAWIGGAAIVAAGAAGAAALSSRLPLPELDRPGLLFVGLLAGFVVWNGISIAWSAAPDRSWNYFNRGLAYLAFALLGLAVGAALRRAPRTVALGLAALIGGACLWALAGKVIPALYDDYGRFARLRSPVGYWNALALLAAIGLPLGLWIASRREHDRRLRATGVVLVYVLGIATVLTYSRGGLLATAFAIVVYLVLARERVEGIAALGVAAAAALPALAWGLTQPGVADDFQSKAVRVEDGAWFGLIVFMGALAAFGVAWWASPRRVSERTGRLVVRGALVVLVAFALLGAVVVVRGGEDIVQQGPSRQLSTGSNNRTKWWGEAWQAFEGQPLIGVGAGSFEYVHRKLRKNKADVTEPHNLPLQFAAETGLFGLALFAGAMGAALVGLWRRRDDAVALALGLALPTYLFHGLLDYDWDFLAVTAPVLFATGVLLASGRPERRVTAQPLWAVVAVLATAALVFSLAAPRLAAKRVDEAYAAIDRNDPKTAVDKAQEARSLNPLSIDPLQAEAAAEEARKRFGRAQRLYVDAVELQPLNARAWYELGCFELQVLDKRQAARRDLERSRDLDPRGPAATALISPAFTAQGPGQPATAPC
jgi:O-antigen ligase/polysaccharide polymerase Wzy-like membrane protein